MTQEDKEMVRQMCDVLYNLDYNNPYYNTSLSFFFEENAYQRMQDKLKSLRSLKQLPKDDIACLTNKEKKVLAYLEQHKEFLKL